METNELIAIVGGSLAGLVVILIVLAVIIYCACGKRKRRDDKHRRLTHNQSQDTSLGKSSKYGNGIDPRMEHPSSLPKVGSNGLWMGGNPSMYAPGKPYYNDNRRPQNSMMRATSEDRLSPHEDDEIFKTIDWGATNKVEVDTCTHAIEQSLHPDGKIDDHQKSPPSKRFKPSTSTDIDRLFASRQAESTKKNTLWGMKIFQDWNMETYGEDLDMTSVDANTLANRLSHFYIAVRPKTNAENNGKDQLYHKSSLINIRCAINRFLTDNKREIDIIRDKEFKIANGVLDGLFKERTRLGLSQPVTHKKVIEPHDLSKISTYLEKANTSPVILRQAVWYLISIHFVTRGMEFHHQLKLDSFDFNEDETGEFVTLKHETQQKTHQGGITLAARAVEGHTEKRMYASPQSTCCPVKLLKLLIEKTDKSATSLFNQYYKEATPETDKWYTAKPLSKRTFSKFLNEICKAASVETNYTPHCLRATAITYLSDLGYESRHIMFMSNHKSESSLKSYNRSMSSTQKKTMSSTLSTMAAGRKHVESTSTMSTMDVSALRTVSETGVSTVTNLISSTTSVHKNEVNPPVGFCPTRSIFKDCTFHFN